MSPTQPPDATPSLPDRSTWLMVLGVFQIVLGCFCLLAVACVAFTILVPMPKTPQGPAIEGSAMIPVAAMYLTLAVIFFWLGIGSICARRWAWTLTVVLSWIWLLMGVAGIVSFVFFSGQMFSLVPQVNVPPQAMLMIQIITGSLMGCIYLFLPGLLLVGYQRESVRATCLRRDPQVPWTDRCPMPVLPLVILHALTAALCMPATAFYGSVVPAFGTVITGAGAVLVIVLMAVAIAYLAWGMYRLQWAAWWGTLLLYVVGTVNTAMFTKASLTEMYEAMHLPAAQWEMIQKSGMIDLLDCWMPWMGPIVGILWLGYLVYLRRYFQRVETQD